MLRHLKWRQACTPLSRTPLCQLSRENIENFMYDHPRHPSFSALQVTVTAGAPLFSILSPCRSNGGSPGLTLFACARPRMTIRLTDQRTEIMGKYHKERQTDRQTEKIGKATALLES